MALRLYNTLSKKEEDFVPLAPPQVTMYTCGPTVYSRPHIGNYSSFLMADLLRRWLETGHGYTVLHAKNITDVGHLLHDADRGDDKIQREAEKERVHPLAIAERHTAEYLEDERALHMREPAHRPRATAFIEHMKKMTEALLASGHAYVTDDGIYFAVQAKTLTPYGALSGNTIAAVKAGARVSVKEAKRHPADFALWKFCVGENAHHVLRWPSPQMPGKKFTSQRTNEPMNSVVPDGFPGWHIECSAMSRALLGDQIDIHTGGEDNIFPHHECEIAQSESVTGKVPFVRCWVHKRRIDMGGAKMSKSLGNVLSLYDIRERGFDPMDLRYYLLSVHYRTKLKFSWRGLEEARQSRRRIVEWLERRMGPEFSHRANGSRVTLTVEDVRKWEREFRDAMDDDLNTPAAIAVIFIAINKCNRVTHEVMTSALWEAVQAFSDHIRDVFGCFDTVETAIPSDVQALADARSQARAGKDFAESDRLRREMESMGYEVRDTPRGQVVRRK